MYHNYRRDEFTGMARIEELPVDKKVAALFNGAEGVGGLVTMLMVRPLHMCEHEHLQKLDGCIFICER